MDKENWLVKGIIIAIISAVATFLVERYGEFIINNIGNFFKSFLITFSPVFIGLLAFLIYWLIRDYRRLRKLCYQHNHAIENIEGLPNRIKILEKEPANRVEANNQLSDRINDLAQDCYKVVKKGAGAIKPEESSTRKLGGLQEIIDGIAKK